MPIGIVQRSRAWVINEGEREGSVEVMSLDAENEWAMEISEQRTMGGWLMATSVDVVVGVFWSCFHFISVTGQERRLKIRGEREKSLRHVREWENDSSTGQTECECLEARWDLGVVNVRWTDFVESAFLQAHSTTWMRASSGQFPWTLWTCRGQTFIPSCQEFQRPNKMGTETSGLPLP